MNKISSVFPRKHFVALSILVGSLVLLWPVSAFAQLNMWFTNTSSYANSNVWITIQRGQAPSTDVTQLSNRPNVTYGSTLTSFNWQMYSNAPGTTWQPGTYGNVYSETISLADIVNVSGGDRGLLTWNSYAASAAVWISYGTPFIGGIGGTNHTSNNYTVSAASPSNPSDPNYQVAYQPFEISYGTGPNGTPGASDQGDLTAINYFTAALQIQSFANTNATGTALQQVGFTQNGPQIGASLTNITAGNTAPGLPGTPGGPAVITNGSGQTIRVLGPSTFGVSPTADGGYGTYANFDSYLAGAGSNNANFTNLSGYNTMANPLGLNYTNKIVSFAFNNSVTNTGSGYALNPTGTFTVVTQAYANGNASGLASTNTYSNIVFNVNPTAQGGQGVSVITNITSQFIYLGSYTAFNGVTTNTDGTPANYSWFEGGDWVTFSNSLTGFVTSAGANSVGVLTAQVAGEIAASFAAGFVGSAAYGNLPSDQWWTNSPTNAFSGATANSNNYDQYAAIIAEVSSNTVYGMIYSDRFTESSPLINAVSLGNTNIGSWLIAINDPITAVVPEPSTYALLTLAGLGLAGCVLRRRMR